MKTENIKNEEVKNQEEEENIKIPEPVNEDDQGGNIEPQLEINVNNQNQNNDNNEEEKEEDENDVPIQFRKKLLSTEAHKKYGNRLREDYKYENEGENGIFEANPRVVKISGFEINKKTKVDIKIINKSKYTERIIILPPTTQFFKIKYLKRPGGISPGLAEVIHLYFTPSKYIYYKDNICINCPGNKIIIPIHAYPKMNIHVKEYIPKFIDLGNVTLDTVLKKEILINNIIDIPFKFEIKPLKTVEEIMINPLHGEINPFNTKTFNLTVNPKKYGIFRGEYEFKINEIDFKPYIFTIYATCHDFYNKNSILEEISNKERMLRAYRKENEKNNEEEEEEKETQKIEENKSNIKDIEFNDIELKSQMYNPDNNNIIKSSKIDEEEKKSYITGENKSVNYNQLLDDFNKTNTQNNLNVSNASDITRPESKILNRYKDFPSNKEREFLNYYNDTDNVIQAKEFKYIRFIGKEPLTEEENNKLLNERNTNLNNLENEKCYFDKNLHTPLLDKEKPVVPRDIKFYLKPNFNKNNNDIFFKARHYFKIFLKALTKIVIEKRANKNLNLINDAFKKHNIKTRDDFAKFCDEDWIEYFSKDQQSGNDDFKFNFMQYKFTPPQNLFREKIWITNDYSLNALKQEIPHEFNLNLDEFPEFKTLERDDNETVKISDFISPGVTQFDVNLGEKNKRPAIESENLIRSERGDSELNPKLNENTKDFYELAEQFCQHIYSEPYDLMFINPSLKNYINLSHNNIFTENSTNYNLQPRFVKRAYLNHSNYQTDFYMKFNLSYEDNENIKNRNIDNEIFYIDRTLDYDNIKKIKGPEEKDLTLKKGEEVDEDNYIFEMKKDDDKNILDIIERDDETLKKEKEKNNKGTYDVRKSEKIKLEKKLQAHKKKWMSLVPTYIEYLNSGIQDPINKLIP